MNETGPGVADSTGSGTGRSATRVGFTLVGVLSDTHGHLYDEVRRALEGVDHIIHAGDVGSPDVLAALRRIAPVTAVRGNCDYDAWARTLPVQVEMELGGVRILVGHIATRLRERSGAARPGAADNAGGSPVVITGHTHAALAETRDGILYLNPGSAGPRRFGRPRTIARLAIRSASSGGHGAHANIEVEIVTVGGG